MNCVFCKIIKGDLPSYTLKESDLFIAILDVSPATKGHTLVIPKRHTPDVYGLNQQEAAALMPFVQELANDINATLKPKALNILQNNGTAAGQVIMHYHMHVVPRYEGDGVNFTQPTTLPDLEELERIHRSFLMQGGEASHISDIDGF